MASGENESKDLENKIDCLKIKEAISLCKKHDIILTRDTKLQQMKWLLKSRLLCKDSKRKDTIESLDWDAVVDESRRKELVEIYNNTIDNAEHIMTMDDPVVAELRKIFHDICHMLEERKQTITDSKAPIMVLGETGSGKSSFINLFLGRDVLPCSLLSNTHVICEIRHSKDASSYALLYPCSDDTPTRIPQGTYDEFDFETFRAELGEHIQAVDEVQKLPKYKKAEIYIAADILKSGLMIVDSPGIGEAKSMESVVLDYILNACTFIYIIDSTSAGGMQDRMQKLVQKVYKKAQDEQREYRPDSAIFVLNKWDGVPAEEQEEVWNDTVRKIQSCWPNCKESQVYKFSTLEAIYIQNQGGMSPKFRPILEQISQLVPLGREILVLRGYRFLDEFASKCIHCFGTHLTQIKLTAEERQQMRAETKERLHTLKTKIDSFFHEQIQKLETDIKAIAKDLGEYIRKQENINKVCLFDQSEIPRKAVWMEMAVAVRSHVYEKIMKMIKTWEEDQGKFKTIGKDITASIEEHFPKFQAEIFEVQQKMSRSPGSCSEGVLEEEEASLLPGFIRRRFSGLKFTKKMAVGLSLAPVLVVGITVNLPVFGFKTIKRKVQTMIRESDFQKAKTVEETTKLCNVYAKTTVTSITDRLGLVKIIEDDMQPLFVYLQQQKLRMKAQIQSDLDLLKTLKEEERCDGDIARTYEPLNAKFQILCRRLKHFLFINLPDQFTLGDTRASEIPYHKLVISDTLVCSGWAADIMAGTSKVPAQTGKYSEICVRKLKEAIQATNVIKYISVQKAYSNIRQECIVRCFGVSSYRGAHYQTLEPLVCTLRVHVGRIEEEMRVNKSNTILRIARDVVTGLKFLHEREKRLVSLDLSMDTVGVNSKGTIKLTNISMERRVLLKPDYKSEKITVGKFVHFHPRFFGYTTKTVLKKQPPSEVKPSQEVGTNFSGTFIGYPRYQPGLSKGAKASTADKQPSTETLYTREKAVKSEILYSRKGQADEKQREDLVSKSFAGYENKPGDDNDSRRSEGQLPPSSMHASGFESSIKPGGKKSAPHSSISGSTDSTVTSRTEHMYTTADDMYACGIMMWELWNERPLESQTLDYAIPNDAMTANEDGEPYRACEIMEKFMKNFQPKFQSPFNASDSSGRDRMFVQNWWSSMKKCLDQETSARVWLEEWEQECTYPCVSLVV